MVAMSVEAQSYKALLRKADRLYEGNFFSEAIPFYKEALAQGEQERAILRLANCYRELRNYKEAEVWYKKAVDKKFVGKEDLYNYGCMLKANGKYEQAIEEFEKYIKVNQQDKKGPLQLAACRYALELVSEPPRYEVKPVPNLNSTSSDFSPVIWTGGLMFTSARGEGLPPIRTNGFTGEPYTDLYFSRRDANRQLGKAALFAPELSTPFDEGPAAFDTTGGILYFTRSIPVGTNNPELGSSVKIQLRLYQAKFSDQGWKDIKEVTSLNVKGYNTGHPALARNGKKLYFISDRPGGKGGTDLYVAEKVGDGWGAPKNCGPEVNTEGNEMFPFVANDGTFYFSSDLLPGLGGLDIFKTTESNGKFSKPENLGTSLNTSFDDFGFMLDSTGIEGYISSNRPGGKGSDDIYAIKYIPPSTDTAAVADKDGKGGKGNNGTGELKPRLRLGGKVYEVDLQPDGQGGFTRLGRNNANNAKVSLKEDGKIIANSTTGISGEYGIDERKPGKYDLEASKKGYWKKSIEIQIREGEPVGFGESYDFELEKILVDQKNSNMPNVYFDLDKAELREETKTKLDMIAKIMIQNPHVVIELAGHACPLGTDRYNMSLSDRRAVAVRNYLLEKGVPKDQVFPKAYGETQLAVPNPKTEADYEANRRAEFVVRKINETPDLGNVIDPRTKRATEKAVVTAPNNFRGVEIKDNTQVVFHTIRKGDTLFSLAKQYDTTVDELIRINNIDGDKIKIGQKLRVRE
jgi:outer membrane protein OmpA-like peptidoglycan-associated protein/tetratricopeptide (TPR) repeat protein